MIKSYKLEVIDDIIWKIKYYGKQGNLYNFNYADFEKVKKSLDTNNNGIYLIKVGFEGKELYVGKIRQAIKEFDIFKKKYIPYDAKIHFYDFGYHCSLNILSYVKQKLVMLINESSYKSQNVDDEVKLDIDNVDKQIADEAIQTIIYLLQAFGINLINNNLTKQPIIEKNNINFSNNQDVNDKDIFFLKGDGFDAKIIYKKGWWILTKGSLVNARRGYQRLQEKNIYFIWKNLFLKNEAHINNEGWCKNDISWRTISSLCGLVRGVQSINGWENMKNKYQQTPDEVYRR